MSDVHRAAAEQPRTPEGRGAISVSGRVAAGRGGMAVRGENGLIRYVSGLPVMEWGRRRGLFSAG